MQKIRTCKREKNLKIWFDHVVSICFNTAQTSLFAIGYSVLRFQPTKAVCHNILVDHVLSAYYEIDSVYSEEIYFLKKT